MTQDQVHPTTTDAGIPVESDEHSLTVGPDGPILLQDHYLIEQMANFNRERIPERQPHAKGGGAFGHFEVTGDVSEYTKAAVFQPGVQTDLLIRFSTVAGERGSPDTWRDPRGFSLKFYTTEGNYDMVGNNTPVFFIKRPDEVPALHPVAEAPGRQQPARPRHAVGLLDPVAGVRAPGDLADGRPGHPADLAAHERLHLPHLHVGQRRGRAVLGQVPLQDRPGHRVLHPGRGRPDGRRPTPTTTSATCTSHIDSGDYPTWTLKMQVMPFEDAKTYRFNPFDLTKVWPHSDYPLIDVGTMTLDRNVTDYHTEIEQAAFEPNNLVPGIALSPDKMLLARGFSYADAHRARLGVNYKQIPVNSPRVPVHSYSKDGAMRINNVSDPVYAPNSKGGPAADTEHNPVVGWYADGDMVRAAYTAHEQDDDWGQAGTMVREVLDDAARGRLVDNVVGHLLNGVTEPVLVRAFEYWRNVDKDLGDQIEQGVRAKEDEKDPKAAEQGNPARSTMQSKA